MRTRFPQDDAMLADLLRSLASPATIPYWLSPGWLKIDPNFGPLRKSPRFQKLVAGK